MLITKSDDNYSLEMNMDDMCSLLELIKTANLPERRFWFPVRKQIENYMK